MVMRRCAAVAAIGLASGGALGACSGASDTRAPSLPDAEVASVDMQSLDLSTLDEAADPCRDFYRYACGGWLDRTTVPQGRGYLTRAGQSMEARNAELFGALLASEEPADDEEVSRLRTFYGACMQADTDGDLSADTLSTWLERLRREPVTDLLLALHEHGIDVFFRYEGWPHPGEPTQHRARIRQGVLLAAGGVTESDVRDYAASLLRGSGESEAAARRAAVRVAKIESALAAAALPGEVDLWGDASTEHVLDRAELARTAPRIPWSRYFAMVEAPERINVNAPAYLEAVQWVLAATSEQGLRDYFRVQFLHQLGPHLPDEAQPPDSQTRRDACRLATIHALGVEFSRQFATRALGSDGRDAATKVADAVREMVVASASVRPWLTSESRRATADKLRQTDLKLGFPGDWPDVGTFSLRPDAHLANVLAARRYEQRRKWRRAQAARRRSDWETLVRPNGAWGMAAARLMIPNGYPDPFSNSMIIPAASLVEPKFSASSPIEVNFATLGSLVGHELIHVAESYMYDAEGRTRDYWTEADVAASQAQLACISDRLVAAQASGERCKEETSADFGGLRAAYAALERELGPSAEQRLHAVDGDGLSMQQRFFLAFAQDYCTKMTPAFAEETAQTDWHAPPGVRVDLAVGNMPEFAEAFSCEPPEAVCSVW